MKPPRPGRVTIVEATRHGFSNRHTFVRLWADRQAHGPARWRPATPGTTAISEALASESRAGRATNANAWFEPRQRPLGVPANAPLQPGQILHLATGVDISADMLTVVLDALAGDKRPGVYLDDLKCVVSQLGSVIAKLDTLKDEQRRPAEVALYVEILRRCASVTPVSS